MATKSGLGLSPLTGRVYWGRSNGANWVGEKRDVTSEFVQIVLQKFGPDTPEQKGMRSEITVDGKPTFEIIVKRLPAPDTNHDAQDAAQPTTNDETRG